MTRKTLFVISLALVSMLAGVMLFQLVERNGQESASTGKPIALQAIPLKNLQGHESVLADFKHDLLVVNFWAPWCVPCRREIPALIQLQKTYGPQGVKVLGIAFDDKDPVSSFAGEYQINYDLFLAENRIQMYSAAFGNPSSSLPFTALLDRQLNIVFRHNGELSFDALRLQIEALL